MGTHTQEYPKRVCLEVLGYKNTSTRWFSEDAHDWHAAGHGRTLNGPKVL
jgi:hypothetical protein